MPKLKKLLKYAVIIIAAFLVVDVAIVMFYSFYRPTIQKADAIIILGAAINTPALYNRSLEGLKLYNEGKASVIVLAGGQDFPGSISEAAYMKTVIDTNSNGQVPLILDNQSHTTYENIQDSKQLIGEGKSVIIVSDDYHLARGVLLAKRAGFNPVYWSSPGQPDYSFHELIYFFREFAAMINYIPKFIFG